MILLEILYAILLNLLVLSCTVLIPLTIYFSTMAIIKKIYDKLKKEG